jgi:hypothetical protein
MAKKYKRNVSQSSTRQTPANASAPASSPAEKTGSSPVSRRGTTEFNPNYEYVIKDLKRIGVLAGSFFVILIVLSFFLN